MRVIKKINNNVAICKDNRDREVIAFGNGIGFPKTPYELDDLSKIKRTFYNVDKYYWELIDSIREDVLYFIAVQLTNLCAKLPYETNDNLVFILADHLSFAVKRAKKGIYVKMPSIYQMELDYPIEVEIGREIVKKFEKEFSVKLPKDEIQAVAMHLVNAQSQLKRPNTEKQGIESSINGMIDSITSIIEQELKVTIKRNTFNYARFESHIRYMLKRISEDKSIESENLKLYTKTVDEYKYLSKCVDEIELFLNKRDIKLDDEEKLYLILHINRVISTQI